MKYSLFIFFSVCSILAFSQTDSGRVTINLNGTWQFDQTTNAFPPNEFTRKIPVPGLIYLAEPKIEDYNKFFQHKEKVEFERTKKLQPLDYLPRYSWYKRNVFIPAELKKRDAVITIKKSKYVTQVYINGMDMGTSMACYTPVEFPITQALKYGQENEILIKVGDRAWLPSQAAGSTDQEKKHYIPGIWDDVFLSFTGKLRMNRVVLLPSVKDKKLILKMQIRSFFPPQIFGRDPMEDSCIIKADIIDYRTGIELGYVTKKMNVRRDDLTEYEMEIDLDNFPLWTPDNPNLCRAKIELYVNGGITDKITKKFGMRDFNRKGKYFYLNGEKTILRGTNITLHRFFEDPECSNLVWDKEWVKKLLINIPKELNWNAMRICVGILPDFWYDLADEYGLMFQNEWLYWQNHGCPEQIKKEFSDWVWSDGSHPSIVIWDAINENWDDYIGNKLIPELMQLDPTRIWDAGYMNDEEMKLNDMDEPHPYEGYRWLYPAYINEKDTYPLGNLDFRSKQNISSMGSGAAQLVNEYGWIWLFRNGNPSKLTADLYAHHLGKNSTPAQNREFQAYWLQLETEWLRSQPYHAGTLAFTYLTNNYGYTGDWFINNINDLEPSPTLGWFKHAFAPQSVFINLPDGRYMKQQEPYLAGSKLSFTLYGINDDHTDVDGNVELLLYDENGNVINLRKNEVSIPANGHKIIPVCITLPEKAGGYLIVSNFRKENGEKTISRRYIKVGKAEIYNYYEMSMIMEFTPAGND